LCLNDQLLLRHPFKILVHNASTDEFRKPDKLSRSEQRFLDQNAKWQRSDGAYAFIQGNRPDTLAQSLNDSPVGLAAWMVDKFHAWSDCNGDLDSCFTKDEMLTNLMVYWIFWSRISAPFSARSERP
jgi:hypothetical protein